MRFPSADKLRFCALALLFTAAAPTSASFVTFETGQVRPLALTPDGTKLVAVNTPDNTIEILDVGAGGLTHSGYVPVGLEPCAVAARNNTEVWVVNHLSDSVSIVDLSLTPPRVVRTLLVGDEPRDIVFAGPGGNRAFITAAHRGQNNPNDPQLTTPSIGRADVWVFDATNLGTSLGGAPEDIVTLFGDTPRALAVSPDGNTVYAAVFHSGNQTTTLSEGVVCNGFGTSVCREHNDTIVSPNGLAGGNVPGGLPGPNRNCSNPPTCTMGVPAPETGLVVEYHQASGQWRDHLGRNWSNGVRFSLPDYDVFAIDTVTLTETDSWSGVGTILLNIGVNPQTGKVYVSNTEAENLTRFEGPGIFGGSTVRGHLHEARVTVIDPLGPNVDPRHLNKHINYAAVPSPAGVAENSLAIPMGMAVSSDGQTLYLAAFGSSKVGVYSTAALEADSFDPTLAPDPNNPTSVRRVALSGGGASGLVLDETNARLYVLTRFDNSVAVVDLGTLTEEDSIALHNPEPYHVVGGRPFLYDAIETSSNGETSCASCHIFGDFDSLAWDLGNPDDEVLDNLNPARVGVPLGMGVFPDHHPMKGPMTTQSLRGMANHGPMHWRGDRSGANDPGGDALDEDAAFKRFNVAFEGLIGREGPLTDAQMQQFTDFILEVTYPPNPIRALDNSLTPDQQAGRNFYFGPQASDVFEPCNGCHRLNESQGFFGSDGLMSFENEPQLLKIAHLRNMYQKVGMFGMPAVDFFNSGNNTHKGPQIRGFGFLHDGSTDTVLRFLNATVFNKTQFGFPVNPGGFDNGSAGDPVRRQVEAFVLAFDSNLRPMVGQQITLTNSNAATVGPRIDLMLARNTAGDCDVVVKGTLAGEQRGWFRSGTDFVSDRVGEAALSDGGLRALAATTDLTYTCVPPGSGYRIGIDRDRDGALDADEVDAAADPDDPTSTPAGSVHCFGAEVVERPSLRITKNLNPAGDERVTVTGQFIVDRRGPPIDPLANGFGFKVIDDSGATVFSRVVPPGAQPTSRDPGWKVNRRGTRWRFRDRDGLVADGVTAATVVDKSNRTPGLYQFRATGKKSDFQADSGLVPLQVVAVLGGGAQTAADQCASFAFNGPNDDKPRCRVSNNLDAIRCR